MLVALRIKPAEGKVHGRFTLRWGAVVAWVAAVCGFLDFRIMAARFGSLRILFARAGGVLAWRLTAHKVLPKDQANVRAGRHFANVPVYVFDNAAAFVMLIKQVCNTDERAGLFGI